MRERFLHRFPLLQLTLAWFVPRTKKRKNTLFTGLEAALGPQPSSLIPHSPSRYTQFATTVGKTQAERPTTLLAGGTKRFSRLGARWGT